MFLGCPFISLCRCMCIQVQVFRCILRPACCRLIVGTIMYYASSVCYDFVIIKTKFCCCYCGAYLHTGVQSCYKLHSILLGNKLVDQNRSEQNEVDG